MICKGDILEAHIRQKRAEGVNYHFAAFCGDGTADLCAVLRYSRSLNFATPHNLSYLNNTSVDVI